MPTKPGLDICADLDPQDAERVRQTLLEKISSSGPLWIEFDGPQPNIFAQQTAIACRSSLVALNHFLGFGTIAQDALGLKLQTDTPSKAPK